MHYITLNLLNPKKLFKNLNGLTLKLYMQYIAHKKLVGPTTASLQQSNIAAFKEISQRYKSAGNAMFDLTRLI